MGDGILRIYDNSEKTQKTDAAGPGHWGSSQRHPDSDQVERSMEVELPPSLDRAVPPQPGAQHSLM